MPFVRKPEMMVPRLRYRVTFRSGPPGRQTVKQVVGKFLEEIPDGRLVFSLHKYHAGKHLRRTVSVHKDNFLQADLVTWETVDAAPRRV